MISICRDEEAETYAIKTSSHKPAVFLKLCTQQIQVTDCRSKVCAQPVTSLSRSILMPKTHLPLVTIKIAVSFLAKGTQVNMILTLYVDAAIIMTQLRQLQRLVLGRCHTPLHPR